MRVYTRTGDNGTTSLLGGTRVLKFHIRLESYGTVDELNAHLGLIRDKLTNAEQKSFLLAIQNKLFSVCSTLANENKDSGIVIPSVTKDDIEMLEKQMDIYLDELPDLKNFILPGGHEISSICHIARTVCRRAERRIIQLSQEEEIDDLTIKFINRLSDFLFVLSRKVLFDEGKNEITWNANL